MSDFLSGETWTPRNRRAPRKGRRANRRENRRENRVWNDQTWFWQDVDSTGQGQYNPDSEDILSGFNPDDFAETATGETSLAFEDIYSGIDDIKGMVEDIPVFDPSTLTGYGDELAGIQALIDRLSAGEAGADYNAAYENAARQMGLTADEYQLLIGNLSKNLTGYQEGMTPEQLAESGVLANMSGLSANETDLRRRSNQANVREMESRAQRFLQDTLADTGSAARMLQASDEANRQISNFALQQDMALAGADAERRIMEFESQKKTWGMMVEANQLSVQQYMDNVYKSASVAIEGYAKKINGIYLQNQDVFQAYDADLKATLAQIDTTYKALQLEIGATAAELDYMTALYDSMVQPYLDAILAAEAERELDFGLDDAWEMAMDVIGAIFASGVIVDTPPSPTVSG